MALPSWYDPKRLRVWGALVMTFFLITLGIVATVSAVFQMTSQTQPPRHCAYFRLASDSLKPEANCGNRTEVVDINSKIGVGWADQLAMMPR